MCFPIQGNIFLDGKLLLDLCFLRKCRYHYKEKRGGLNILNHLKIVLLGQVIVTFMCTWLNSFTVLKIYLNSFKAHHTYTP